MKRKIWTFLLAALFTLGLLSGLGGVFAEETSSWSTDTETGKIKVANEATKFYLNSASAFYPIGSVSGDYTVTTKIKGDKSIADTTSDRYDVGVLAWYLDQNNWVSFSAAWWAGFSESKVTSMLITVADNGALAYHDHFFDNPTYNTAAVYQKYSNDETELSVKKAYDAENNYDVYTFFAEGEELYSLNIGVSAKHRAAAAKTGYVGSCTDAGFIFDDIKLMVPGPDGGDADYQSVTGDPEGVKGVGGWTYAEEKYSVTATGNAVQNHIILPNQFSALNYSLTVTAALSEVTADTELMVSGWYIGQSDQIMFSLKNSAEGYKFVLEGKVKGVAVTPQEAACTPGANVEMSVQKIGNTLTFLNGEDTVFTLKNDAFSDGTNCLIGVGNAKAVIGAAIEEIAYNAYDFYRTSINDVSYRVSAKDMESFTVTDGTYELLAEEDTYSVVIWDSNTSGKLDYKAEFSGAATNYGLYLYYADADNNIALIVSEDNIQLKTIMEGQETNENFASSGLASSLSLSLLGKAVSAKVGETPIFTDKVIDGIDIVSKFEIGFFAKGGTLTVSDLVTEGFTPFSDKAEGDYILRGDSYSTWRTEEGKLIGDLTNGTTWNQTLAFRANDKLPSAGYYVGTTMQVTQKTGTEWKAGVLPYYADGGNFVYVWISQWAEQGVTILMHSFLNGEISGETWRETAVTCDITALNYLEIKVSGDTVSVYLNKSFSPVAVASFSGLGEKTGANFMGFNIYQVSAEFSNVTISDSRIFKNTEKPTISVIGTTPTTGMVGTEIKLPVYTGSTSSADGAVEIEVEVYYGEEKITLQKNAFTPTKAGEYKIVVTATDEWGNTENESFTVNVAAKAADEKGCKGCKSSASAVFLMLAAVAVAAFKKKRI